MNTKEESIVRKAWKTKKQKVPAIIKLPTRILKKNTKYILDTETWKIYEKGGYWDKK